MAKKSLYTALNAKAQELRGTQDREASAAKAFIAASEAAAQESLIAKLHATAVEEALDIISKAGVTL